MELGRKRLHHAGQAEVLNDDRVHASGLEQAELFLSILQLPGEDERVERAIAPHPVLVQERHELRQVFLREIVCAQPGVEPGQAKENGVRAIGDGRTGAVPVASRGEKLGRRGAGARSGGWSREDKPGRYGES